MSKLLHEVNSKLKALYDKYEGDLTNADFYESLMDLYYDYTEKNSDIYDLIEYKIPLFLYFEYTDMHHRDSVYYERFEGKTKKAIRKYIKERVHKFYGPDDNV